MTSMVVGSGRFRLGGVEDEVRALVLEVEEVEEVQLGWEKEDDEEDELALRLSVWVSERTRRGTMPDEAERRVGGRVDDILSEPTMQGRLVEEMGVIIL